uniref:Uncharacterized protein n=1 Tax=Romanomermis culicivorax TaxID=13658 RepID=A0A915KQ17_ROMCU
MQSLDGIAGHSESAQGDDHPKNYSLNRSGVAQMGKTVHGRFAEKSIDDDAIHESRFKTEKMIIDIDFMIESKAALAEIPLPKSKLKQLNSDWLQ